MEILGFPIEQILTVAGVGVFLGLAIKWWNNRQAREQMAAALTPISPSAAAAVAPAPATGTVASVQSYFNPLGAAQWEAIQHDRALRLATEDLTSIEMLNLRARAGVQLRLEQEAKVAQYMQAMREPWPTIPAAGPFAQPQPATTVNVNAPTPTPASAATVPN